MTFTGVQLCNNSCVCGINHGLVYPETQIYNETLRIVMLEKLRKQRNIIAMMIAELITETCNARQTPVTKPASC